MKWLVILLAHLAALVLASGWLAALVLPVPAARKVWRRYARTPA